MQNNQMRNLMRGAWMLSLAALIAKILSAVYRVPFQNLVGDTGFYVYQQVYPLYGIGMTFALTGFPVFISKLVAEARDPDMQAEITHRALVLMTWIGGGMFLVLELGAEVIARAMADQALAPLVRSVGFMFLTMPVLATARGYFQGTFDMSKTAVSQVVEQVVRVGVILVAAWLAVRERWNVYTMGTWAMTGAFFGGLAAIIVIWQAYAQVFRDRQFTFPGISPYLDLLRRFFKEGGSIALFATLLIVMQLIDSFTVTRGLAAAGMQPDAAKALKGVYDRGQPLVQLGLVVATAFSSTLLPSLTRNYALGRDSAFIRTARELFNFNLGLSLAATSGLIVLMPALNWLLFGDMDETNALRVYALSIVLMAMINAYNAVLQSQNRFRGTTYVLGVGFLLKLLTNQWLVTRYGTMGASIATVAGLAVIVIGLYFQLPAGLRARDPRHFGWRLVPVIGGMTVVVRVIETNLPLYYRTDTILICAVGMLAGVLVFVFGGALVQLYSVREVLAIPLGRRFMKWWFKHGPQRGTGRKD